MFSFPLYVGAAGFGVLDVYADSPGSLTSDQLASALVYAEVATQALVDRDVADADGELDAGLDSVLSYRARIYQAQGIVTVDLEIDLAEALARMRAHAFATSTDLGELAAEIVAGRVRLERDDKDT